MNRALAFARLVRLPNVFTAIADVSVGLIVIRHNSSLLSIITLPCTSACLYGAGMAWNDYADRQVDSVERPNRPIPSGAIRAKAASMFACWLALFGIGFAAIAGWIDNQWSPLPVLHAAGLVALILAYNFRLKHTSAGPWAMGACRFINMLLGFSVASTAIAPWFMRFAAATILGIYVVGISVIAKDEAGAVRRQRLTLGLVFMLAAVMGTAMLPALATSKSESWAVYCAAGLSLLVLIQARTVISKADSVQVQSLVKTAIMGIILLDACLAVALAGPIGLVVVVFLGPAIVLGRWLYST